VVASAWDFLDCSSTLFALGHCAALQQNPIFKLVVLHLFTALAFVPGLATLETNRKFADWTLRTTAQ